MEQGTDEWFNARCGMVTASRLTDVLGTKGKRRKYAEQLARESIQGFRVVTEPNEYMIWGTETEPEARSAYEARSGSLVDLVGFVIHPAIKRSGASPDGLVGEDGLVEIKCPTTKTHITTLDDYAVPAKHLPQMQWQMACTGRKWCDFVSYDPRIEDSYFCKRVMRDDEFIAMAEQEVIVFLEEVDLIIEKEQQNAKNL
jgi:putative phage-type endonuclease